MFKRSARFYDALYGFKDYGVASGRLRTTIERLYPGAETLLDVACGTGRHLEHLRRRFQVEGLDVNPELLAIARERCPGVVLHQGDMTSFALGQKYDVVTCLFSSIGYVVRPDRLRQSVAAMTQHLTDDGLLVIEPWFYPEQYWVGHLAANFVDEPDVKVAWMYLQQVQDRVSVLDIQYLVGTPDGVESFSERHEVGLFTDEEYRQAIEACGLAVEYDREGLFGRGMYIGRRNKRETAVPG